MIVVALVLVGILVAPAQPVTPTPTPSVSDNTPQVCATSAKTVETGLEKFVGQMESVRKAASSGDLVAAEAAVKAAGTQLVLLGTALRVDANTATSPSVRNTLTDLAAEFEAQGRALDSLTALQTFDIKRIEALSSQMSALCGGPSPSPLPTPAPTPSPTG